MKTCILCHRIEVPLREIRTMPLKGTRPVGYMKVYVCVNIDESCMAAQRENGEKELTVPSGVT